MIVVLMLFLSGFNLVASSDTTDLQLFRQRAKQKPLVITFYKSVRIFKSSESKKSCEACQAIDQALQKKFIVPDQPNLPGTFNPALSLCLTLKGKLQTLYDIKENEVSVCSFSDQSFFYSWDLYKLR